VREVVKGMEEMAGISDIDVEMTLMQELIPIGLKEFGKELAKEYSRYGA